VQPHPATTTSTLVDSAMRQVNRESERQSQRSCSPPNASGASGSKSLVIPEGAGPVNPLFLLLIFSLGVVRLLVGASR
jgi:hypothetical protein